MLRGRKGKANCRVQHPSIYWETHLKQPVNLRWITQGSPTSFFLPLTCLLNRLGLTHFSFQLSETINNLELLLSNTKPEINYNSLMFFWKDFTLPFHLVKQKEGPKPIAGVTLPLPKAWNITERKHPSDMLQVIYGEIL